MEPLTKEQIGQLEVAGLAIAELPKTHSELCQMIWRSFNIGKQQPQQVDAGVLCWMWVTHSDIVHAFESHSSQKTLCGVQKGFDKYREAKGNDPFLRKCKRCKRCLRVVGEAT